jgi:hypothetical protein
MGNRPALFFLFSAAAFALLGVLTMGSYCPVEHCGAEWPPSRCSEYCLLIGPRAGAAFAVLRLLTTE